MTLNENSARSSLPADIPTRVTALLTVEEAAQRMNIPPRSVRRLIAERRISFCWVGDYVRLAADDVEGFIDAGRVEAQVCRRRPRRR